MTSSTLDYPLGRAYVPALPVRRTRPLPHGARLVVAPGDMVQPADVLAEGAEGMTGTMRAGLGGRVLTASDAAGVTIDGVASVVSGMLGIGGPVVGPITFLPRGESPAVVQIPPGAVVVFPQRVSLMFLQRAAAAGAAAVLAASAAAVELEAFARADLGAVLDGSAPAPAHVPLTVLLTEGLGEAAMDISLYQALARRANDLALVTGFTALRRNIRPEALLSLPSDAPASPDVPLPSLRVGSRVSVVAGPRRGARGEVAHLFAFAQRGLTGQHFPSAWVRFPEGDTETLPLHTLVALS